MAWESGWEKGWDEVSHVGSEKTKAYQWQKQSRQQGNQLEKAPRKGLVGGPTIHAR
jgi:hypothetical protein